MSRFFPRVAAAEEAEFRPFVVPALASSEAESVGGGRDSAAAGKQREVFAEFPRKLLREVRRQIQKYFVMETRPREIKYRDEEDEVALKPGSHRLLPKGESAATVTDFSTTSRLRETGFSFASPFRRNLRVEARRKGIERSLITAQIGRDGFR